MPSKENDFLHLLDEELVKEASNGNEKAEHCLLKRYKDAVSLTANAFFSKNETFCANASLDADDLFQEGRLGLLSAIYSYKDDKNTSFKTYASKCILNEIRSAVRAGNRKKNSPESPVLSLTDIDIPSPTSPEDKIISEEITENLHNFLKTELSRAEFSVLKLYLAGDSYKSIAITLGTAEKSVDNAIQRIRMKLRRFLNESKS